MLQPDFGSTILFAGVWFVMVLLSGLSLKRIGRRHRRRASACWSLTYLFYENGRHRIDAFLGRRHRVRSGRPGPAHPAGGRLDRVGLWLGTRKLPARSAYRLYLFGDRRGIRPACLRGDRAALSGIVVRVLVRLLEEEDLFTVLAAAGLIAQFGGQAFINILVNLQLFPVQGHDPAADQLWRIVDHRAVPDIGLLLAITRRNPFIKPRTVFAA
jgi:cell division protein FtsW